MTLIRTILVGFVCSIIFVDIGCDASTPTGLAKQELQPSAEATTFGKPKIRKPKIEFGRRFKTGRLDSPIINESSGLAASRGNEGCFWTHNDNGGVGGPFLINSDGKLVARLKLDGIPFRDWEAIDCRKVNGTNFIVLADVGDNLARYEKGRIYLLKEPVVEKLRQGEWESSKDEPLEIQVTQIITLQFTYPDGPVDCEAMAVDAASQLIYLVSKRQNKDATTRIHTLPWPTDSDANATLKEPAVAARLETPFNESMVTGMDFSSDGTMAVVRNYAAMWIYQRTPEETWAEAFASPVGRSLLPLQRQGESICFSTNGKSVLLTSEGARQAIWQIDFSPAVPETGNRSKREP